jgi:hypothetical protein
LNPDAAMQRAEESIGSETIPRLPRWPKRIDEEERHGIRPRRAALASGRSLSNHYSAGAVLALIAP